MEKWIRHGLVLALLGVIGHCFGQDSTIQYKNALRVDVLGPPTALVTAYPTGQWRVSAEYERLIIPQIPISAIVDLEYYFRQYEFERLFVWPAAYGLTPERWSGFSDQQDLALLLGLRYASKSSLDALKHWYWLVETRIAFLWRTAVLRPDTIFRPNLSVKEYGIGPRLKMGAGYRLGKRWGLEASLEGMNYKFLGDESREWRLVGELNVVFRF